MKKFLAALSLFFVGTACAFAAACTNKNTVSISFEENGGAEMSDVVKQSGEEYTLPTPPERSGYEFEGWYLTVDFSGEPVETVSVTENTTYYAKWAQLYAITLDLNGGTLSQTTLYLKAGANVYDFMSDYTPVKEGLTFGAWFDGANELARNARMTENGLTLTAKYKAAYTVEIYKQNVDGTDYVKDEDIVDSDYVGATVAPELSFTGFKQVENASSVPSKVISATASDNVLKFYYDREEYTVNFVSNYPDGSANVTRSVSAKYGTEVELPIDFTFEGYCLVGYSTTQNGEVEYGVNYIDTALYKKDGESTTENAKFSPERNTSLYAVWNKGYTDMFGGNDYMFLLEADSEVIYLARGNVFFKGDYRPLTKGFTITTAQGDIEGRLNDDGTFSYATSTRARTYYLYTADNTVDENARVILDAYNGITYIYKETDPSLSGDESAAAEVERTSKGTYSIEDGTYQVQFNDGYLSGTNAVMVLGTVKVSGNTRYVFRVRNEEEVAMGVIPRIGITPNGTVGVYNNGMFGITLNGFGVATLKGPSQDYNYNYTFNEDRTQISLTSSFGIEVLVARLMELDGYSGYMLYDKKMELNIEQDGSSLVLDGICRATYVKGNTTINGYYQSMGSSAMGGSIIKVMADGVSYNLLVSAKVDSVTNEDGTTTDITTYSFAEKPETYAEYNYSDANGVYYHCLVLDDTQVGKASIYQRISQTEYAKIATGSYEYNANNDTYLFTREEYFVIEGASTAVLDMSVITSFVFSTGTYTSTNSMNITSTYEVHFWLSSTTEEGSTDNTTVYTGEKGATLTLVAGFALYNDGTKTVASGMYSLSDDGIMQISADSVTYIRIDEENKSFILLETAPSTAYEIKSDGSYGRTDYIYFDGTSNGAAYTYKNGEETITLEGSFEKTDRTTAFGYFIFTFTSGEVKFNFIRVSASSTNLFAKYNTEYNGEYASEDDGILTLDGYNYMASFQSMSGYKYEGYYSVISDNVICLQISKTTLRLYFDLGDNKSFKLRGTEYGTYLLMDNNNTVGTFIELDGYGKAKVFTAKTENGETVRSYIDENATYEMSGRLFTVSYTENETAKSVVGKLMTFTTQSGNFSAFVIIHDEVVQTYVNEKDFSILILDNSGGAVKYDEHGIREDGSYTLITDSLLYYVNNTASDAFIYEYDIEKGTANTVSLTERGYYTSKLESLLFSKYGFAIFNGTTRYYYTVGNDENVTIFRLAKEGETPNKYGYVEENFGKFDDKKTEEGEDSVYYVEYDGKRYFKNSGYALKFARGEAEGNKKYPVLESTEQKGDEIIEHRYPLEGLTFTPSGTEEFSVGGTVIVNNREYNCTVVRTVDGDNVETYVALPLRMGYYRFDIEINFKGEKESGQSSSTYTVTGMSRVIELPAYNYLYTVYMYSMFDSMLGTNMASGITNTLGTISINFSYNDEGIETGSYVVAEFGEDSGAYDADGNLISIANAEYTTEKQNNSTMYVVDFTGADGYTYRLRFIYEAFQQMSAYGYRLYGLTRVQTLSCGEYTIKVERTIASDVTNMGRGRIMFLELSKGETAIEMTSGIINADGSVVYIVRTFGEGENEGKIISTKYYTINFKEITNEVVGGDNDKYIVPVYESATVTEEDIVTVYAEDGVSYVDMAGSEIRLVYINGYGYSAEECTYDAATGKYTVKTYSSSYTVEIKDGKAVITEIVEEDAPQENV